MNTPLLFKKIMILENATIEIDVSDVSDIVNALAIKYSSRNYEEEPTIEPTKSFDLITGGALKLTMKNGATFVIGTSEWATVDYYAPPNLSN